MEWKKLLSEKRIGKEARSGGKKDLRSEFEKDYHRIILSSSFRRLQDKTQVFPLDKSDFIAIKLEKEGYLTQENKFYRSDKRNAISYTMRPDKFWEASVPSGLVNKFFTVKVSPEYYTKDENGKIDPDRAWKLIHQILLNYFDEMQITDMSSGFIQTPWEYERFSESRQAVRTRVTVKQSGISTEELVFQIKISSEEAPLVGMSNESSYREVVRILKKFEPLISEFQSRLSKN